MDNKLISKIKSKDAQIGIIGLGYVGLPLVKRFCEEGFRVIGFDTDPKKVEQLNKGKSYIKHIPSSVLSSFMPLFSATTDMERLALVDGIIICVPTPLTDKREPDMQYVENTAQAIATTLRPGQIISLESTTYPETTRKVLLPIFESKGMKAGRDFYLVYSSEREDPGNSYYNIKSVPKVVSGITEECLKMGACLYSFIVDEIIPVSSAEVAEASKLLENIYRAVNIALVNELKVLFDRMGIDIWEVIEAAKTKPFGFQAFYPGPGLGGHCIPIDPFYLTWKAKEYDFTTRFIELAGEINTNMPYWVVQKVADALNEREKSIKGSRILILGAAYKKDVDDMRESPALKLIKLLLDKGASVEYNDPYIPKLTRTRHYQFSLSSVDLDELTIKGYDCIIVATDHSCYDYNFLLKHASLIIDTRNAIKGTHKKVVKA
ncbi:nucleotide sugar dehydrogenase [Thermodesulfovibrionales bacterium]|nr:nucleotide sugar dehydrogenase [Thermodesulfovibrionales bacterium]